MDVPLGRTEGSKRRGSKQKEGLILPNEEHAHVGLGKAGGRGGKTGKILTEDSGSEIVFWPQCSPT